MVDPKQQSLLDATACAWEPGVSAAAGSTPRWSQSRAAAVTSGRWQQTAEAGASLVASRRIWQGYLMGQLFNVGKAALWWSTFGILAVSMLDSDIALAATRLPFNLALLISSPLAVVAAERVCIRSLLLATTIGRMAIWSLLIPAAWIILTCIYPWTNLLWGLMIGLMFVDGLQVAFSNAVDIDCGGVDSLSAAHNLPLTDYLRYRYTTIHQLVFDSSFIILTPPIVTGFVFISRHFGHGYGGVPWVKALIRLLPPSFCDENSSVFVLALGIALVFGLLSAVSIYYYARYIPKTPTSYSNHLDPLESGEWPSETSVPLGLACREKMWEVVQGLNLVLSDSALQWRLILLAVETALEDAMVSVIIPLLAMHSIRFLGHTTDKTVAALISVVIIAVGKLGGVMAGTYLSARTENQVRSLKGLFALVLCSSLSLGLVPWGYQAAQKRMELSRGLAPGKEEEFFPWALLTSPPPALSCGAVLLGTFLFFVLSTYPKIGFASLIQTMVASEDQAAKVFGFVGMFVTVTDGIMITLINLIFFNCGRENFVAALWIVFGFYVFHGLIECLLGPRLVAQHAAFPPAYLDSDVLRA